MATKGSIVKLNVGGLSFHTDRSILVSSSKYFRNLLEGDVQSLTCIADSQEIMIERCGRHFECILQYLRTGHVHHPSYLSLHDIQLEAEYYQLDALVQKIYELIAKPPTRYIEYSFLDISELIPHPATQGEAAQDIYQIIHVVDVKQSHNICWEHGGKYGVPATCHHAVGNKKNLYQLTAKLLVKKGNLK